MAARTVLAASTSSHPLLLSIHSSSPLKSVSFNLSCHSLPFPLTLAAAPAPERPFVAAAATNQAASALNCASHDQGLANFTQDYEGLEEATIFDSEILLSEPGDELGPVAAVPKKRTSKSKKNIRKNVWKRKGAVAAMKAYSLAKSILTGKSTSFMTDNVKKDT